MARTDAQARRAYVITHWGKSGQRRVRTLRVADPCTSGTVTALGTLVSVTYLTIKAGDSEPTEYEHHFEGRKPVLAYNQRGLLLIVGGEYTVTPRGIEG